MKTEIVQRVHTLDAAAEKLDTTRRTIERKAKAGHIKVVRIFGRPRITDAELARLMSGEAA